MAGSSIATAGSPTRSTVPHTQCGFTYAGDCADYTPVIPTPYACKAYDPTGGFYLGRHAQPGLKKWPHAKTYRQVITTYVKQ